MTKQLLNNRYQVLEVLGAGGFGKTFLAEDTYMPSRRRCAIKQLKTETHDPKMLQMLRERFEREAATLEYLGEGSEQIPKLYAYFSENEEFYLVQEWVKGETLSDALANRGKFPETIVRDILLSLLNVLDYIHSKGIIHRDIKPDNIIIREADKTPVLIDFGAVKEMLVSVNAAVKYATKSLVIGTPGYIPSEQAAGRPVYNSDIYSLGLSGVYLLTQIHPQDLETDPQTGEILWLQHADDVSSQLVKVINKAIQPYAHQRYSNAVQMLNDLRSEISANSVGEANTQNNTGTKTEATMVLSPNPNVNHNSPSNSPKNNSNSNPNITNINTKFPTQNANPIVPTTNSNKWQVTTFIIFAVLAFGGLITGIILANNTRSPISESSLTTVNEGSIPENQTATDNSPTTETSVNENSGIESSPGKTQIPPISEENTTANDTLQQDIKEPPVAPIRSNNPPPEQVYRRPPNPQPTQIFNPPTQSNRIPQGNPTQNNREAKPEQNNQSPQVSVRETPTPTPTPTPENQTSTNINPQLRGIPTGTQENTVRSKMGKPTKVSKGYFPNTRAYLYKLEPKRIDLGYVFDKNSGKLRQTEASFAPTVQPQVLGNTLQKMLKGNMSSEINQGLQQVYQRQKSKHSFQVNGLKGVIKRSKDDWVYVGVWDADFH
ncbi:MAG: protein kinase [Cyanobacteria bacterium P01_A01_bin.84]